MIINVILTKIWDITGLQFTLQAAPMELCLNWVVDSTNRALLRSSGIIGDIVSTNRSLLRSSAMDWITDINQSQIFRFRSSRRHGSGVRRNRIRRLSRSDVICMKQIWEFVQCARELPWS